MPQPSRQFQQLMAVHSKIGFEQQPDSLPSLLGEPHPQYPGDSDVTPLKANTFGSFESNTAWRVHQNRNRLPQSLRKETFSSTMFNEIPEIEVPKAYTGKPV